jgi:hypothetical protein
VVADGAYAKADFLKPAKALGMTVVSRLRKDAALRTLPGPRPAGKRGRPRTYGEDKIDLAKRGGQHCKQIVGAGHQQVRFIWANVGAFQVCLWTFTMTEVWAWNRKEEELVDRSASPWDKSSRRPSHADKRRAWRQALLGEEIRAVLRPGVTEEEIQATAERLLSLAA